MIPVKPTNADEREPAVELLSRGEDAERRVEERQRDALPPDYRLYPNVNWTGPLRDRAACVR